MGSKELIVEVVEFVDDRLQSVNASTSLQDFSSCNGLMIVTALSNE